MIPFEDEMGQTCLNHHNLNIWVSGALDIISMNSRELELTMVNGLLVVKTLKFYIK